MLCWNVKIPVNLIFYIIKTAKQDETGNGSKKEKIGKKQKLLIDVVVWMGLEYRRNYYFHID